MLAIQPNTSLAGMLARTSISSSTLGSVSQAKLSSLQSDHRPSKPTGSLNDLLGQSVLAGGSLRGLASQAVSTSDTALSGGKLRGLATLGHVNEPTRLSTLVKSTQQQVPSLASLRAQIHQTNGSSTSSLRDLVKQTSSTLPTPASINVLQPSNEPLASDDICRVDHWKAQPSAFARLIFAPLVPPPQSLDKVLLSRDDVVVILSGMLVISAAEAANIFAFDTPSPDDIVLQAQSQRVSERRAT
jgi:hypothetical protein